MNYEFYDLPRVLQDRLIESSRGAAVPLSLGYIESKDPRSALWLLAALISLGLWAGFTLQGFGQLENEAALGGMLFLLAHLALGALFFGLLLLSYANMWRKEQRPIKSGAYLFPAALLTLKGSSIVEHSLADVKELKGSGQQVSVTLASGTGFKFSVDSDAAEVIGQLKIAQKNWLSLSENDLISRARLHPLVDSGVPNPLAPTQPLAVPRLARGIWLVGVVLLLGVLSGFAVYTYRNQQSEVAIYRLAVEENTVESYQAYLARGGTRPDVASLYLPRAELLRARATGTVAAIEEFLEQNAESRIIDEVRAFHRQALLEELAKAQNLNTVAALDELPQRFRAHSLIATELQAARHALYENALKEFSLVAASGQTSLIPAVKSLLDYSEKNGPDVTIRMRQTFTQDRDNLDKIVSKSRKYYMGRRSLPTQYFIGEKVREYEQKLGEQLVNSLQAHFSPDLLKFSLDSKVRTENEQWSESALPAISIVHGEKLSGGYVGGKPKGIYLGASVRFKASLSIPGQEKPLMNFAWNVWRHPDFRILEESGTSFSDVYASMLQGAFNKFSDKFLSTWIKSQK